MLPRDLDFFFWFDISKDVSFNEKKKKMTVFFRWPKNSDQSLTACYNYIYFIIRCVFDARSMGMVKRNPHKKSSSQLDPFWQSYGQKTKKDRRKKFFGHNSAKKGPIEMNFVCAASFWSCPST